MIYRDVWEGIVSQLKFPTVLVNPVLLYFAVYMQIKKRTISMAIKHGWLKRFSTCRVRYFNWKAIEFEGMYICQGYDIESDHLEHWQVHSPFNELNTFNSHATREYEVFSSWWTDTLCTNAAETPLYRNPKDRCFHQSEDWTMFFIKFSCLYP